MGTKRNVSWSWEEMKPKYLWKSYPTFNRLSFWLNGNFTVVFSQCKFCSSIFLCVRVRDKLKVITAWITWLYWGLFLFFSFTLKNVLLTYFLQQRTWDTYRNSLIFALSWDYCSSVVKYRKVLGSTPDRSTISTEYVCVIHWIIRQSMLLRILLPYFWGGW